MAIVLPPLGEFDATGLAPRGDHEAVDFADLDLGGQDAAGSTFLGCRFVRCVLDGLSLSRARVAECLLDDIRAVDLDLSDGTWRDSLVTGARFGAVRAPGATWDDVRLRASRANLLDFRGARLTGVVLEDCAIDELDLGGATAVGVRLRGCTVDRLILDEARLADVDLSGARIGTVHGIEGLRGATLDMGQVLELAPVMAVHLGVNVR